MNEKLILSMTTWPPRFTSAKVAMQHIIRQRKKAKLQDRVHCVLVLSEEEACDVRYRREACELILQMEKMGVEVIYDRGNIRSHKKIIPVLEKYPDATVLVVDDDNIQQDGWLQVFIQDHDAHPGEVIYGQSNRRISVKDGKVCEDTDHFFMLSHPYGQLTENVVPASGAAGTLYPSGTFKDPRFFDRELFMELCPSSDETWQYVFAKLAGKKFRCLSSHNFPITAGADQSVALYRENRYRYAEIHNRIAAAIPEYIDTL